MNTTTAAASAISVSDLRTSFGEKTVLAGVDLSVLAGTVFALLGPNGAGKTTTVRILSSLIAADGGQVSMAGHDLAEAPEAVRSVIGVTGQFSAVDNLLTARENLVLMADLYRTVSGGNWPKPAIRLTNYGWRRCSPRRNRSCSPHTSTTTRRPGAG